MQTSSYAKIGFHLFVTPQRDFDEPFGRELRVERLRVE